jgi:O-antigen/teichoic acid export membrane protein
MTDALPLRSGDFQDSKPAVTVSRGASYLTIQTLITSAAQVVAFAVLARIITVKEMGVLTVLSLVIAFFQAVDGAAFLQTAAKFIGELEGQLQVASSIFYHILRICVFISIPFALVTFLYSSSLASLMLGSVAYAYLFKVLAVDVLINAGALPVATGTLFGLKKFKAASAIGTGGSVLRYFLIILLIILMKDFVGLVIAWVLSDLATFVAYAAYILRIVGWPRAPFPIGKLVSFTWPLSIGSVTGYFYSWFDRALLVVFVPLTTLGIYNAALTAFGVLSASTYAVNSALLPVYSGISGRENRLESCRQATSLASRYASFTIVPIAFGFVAAAQPALTLFVGKAYVTGTQPLMILSCTFALTVFGLALSPMLVALSETQLSTAITIVSVLAGLGSAFLLLPIFGINGASVARALVMVITTALTMIILNRKKAMGLDVEPIWKSTVAGAVMAGALYLTQTIIYSPRLLPGYMVLGCVIYLVALRFLKAVRKGDIDFIQDYLGPRFAFGSKLLRVVLLSD